jgi:hypothetical protein
MSERSLLGLVVDDSLAAYEDLLDSVQSLR